LDYLAVAVQTIREDQNVLGINLFLKKLQLRIFYVEEEPDHSPQ